MASAIVSGKNRRGWLLIAVMLPKAPARHTVLELAGRCFYKA